MIFRLKTSIKTEEIFLELEKRTYLKPHILVKHAICWSILEDRPITKFDTDSKGLDMNRQTITGEYDTFFKVLVEQVQKESLTDEEYFPYYIKAHIDRGATILQNMYNHSGNLDGYIMKTLGVGDTV